MKRSSLFYISIRFRRSRENRGMLTKLQVEKNLLRKEIFDRIKTGKIFYTPKGDYLPVGFKTIPKVWGFQNETYSGDPITRRLNSWIVWIPDCKSGNQVFMVIQLIGPFEIWFAIQIMNTELEFRSLLEHLTILQLANYCDHLNPGLVWYEDLHCIWKLARW